MNLLGNACVAARGSADAEPTCSTISVSVLRALFCGFVQREIWRLVFVSYFDTPLRGTALTQLEFGNCEVEGYREKLVAHLSEPQLPTGLWR